MVSHSELTARHHAMLAAVAQGRARITLGRCPALTVDGRWCDQQATRTLVELDLVRPAGIGAVGALVPARLTEAGRLLVDARRAAA
ncbi:MAG TPA: hypothetical protein VGD67_17300 [Pseudonocardiaceae bacterium]